MKNSFFKISTILTCLMLLGCASDNDDSPTPPINNNSGSANKQVTHISIGGYKLDVFIPENYDESKKYPVIYFNDGQSLFQAGSWELDDKLNDLVANDIIEEVIVVGIYSDGNRTDNYTPYEDSWITQNWNMTKPNAANYTQAIIDIIIPYIESNYSAIQDKTSRAFMGYSLGGLQATWVQFISPNIFQWAF